MSNQIDNAYKTSPTHDELRVMDRDLRFHPCEVEDPSVLTPDQVGQPASARAGLRRGLSSRVQK